AAPAAPRASETVAAQVAGVEACVSLVRDRVRAGGVLPRVPGGVLSDRREIRRLVAGRGAVRRDAEHLVPVDRGALRRVLSGAIRGIPFACIFDTLFRAHLSFTNN